MRALFINFYAHDTNKNILAFTLHNNVPITITKHLHAFLINSPSTMTVKLSSGFIDEDTGSERLRNLAQIATKSNLD